MIRGVRLLNKAVECTLGPKGNNVVITDPLLTTNDGVTIANSVKSDDPVINAGVEMIREAAQSTNDSSGDGTTTSIIIASEIIGLSKGRVDVDELNKASDVAVSNILSHSVKKMSPTKVKQIAQIASKSEKIGEMIEDIYRQIKSDDIIVEKVNRDSIDYKIQKGYSCMIKLPNQQYFNNGNIFLGDCPVIVVDGNVNGEEIVPILEEAIQSKNKEALLVCEKIDNIALSNCIVNFNKGIVTVVPVEAHKNELQDIAAIVGADLLDKKSGTASKVQIKDRILTISGDGDTSKREEYYADDKDALANIKGRVGIIEVGGQTDIERNDMFLRVEDAVKATASALEMGYVPGAGNAYYYAIDPSNYEEKILLKALQKPAKTICKNAGIKFKSYGYGKGINANTGEVVDLIDSGIIDSTKVVVEAIKNAVSVASRFLLTKGIVNKGNFEEVK